MLHLRTFHKHRMRVPIVEVLVLVACFKEESLLFNCVLGPEQLSIHFPSVKVTILRNYPLHENYYLVKRFQGVLLLVLLLGVEITVDSFGRDRGLLLKLFRVETFTVVVVFQSEAV